MRLLDDVDLAQSGKQTGASGMQRTDCSATAPNVCPLL
jgi:hypothetical protein